MSDLQPDLERIAVFTREDGQAIRFESLRKLFGRANIELIMAEEVSASKPADLIIAMGGDGTVLHALGQFAGVPVLAVNFGHLGFLTASARDELDKVVVRLLSDDYFIDERLALAVEHRGVTHRCVNELVIKSMMRMVSLSLSINGRNIHTPRGDGLIVGTPTGSTAYLLSTGAPIVTPDVDCILVQPLNEYSFSSRSIVLPGSARVGVTVEPGNRDDGVILVNDGGDALPLVAGDHVEIARSEIPARLVYFEHDYFFRNLKARLRW